MIGDHRSAAPPAGRTTPPPAEHDPSHRSAASALIDEADPELAEAVAAAVLAAFERLPKTGKPQPHEHTVLAGFAVTFDGAGAGNGAPPQPRAVALGTGTKCLGGAAQSAARGELLLDGHAEVVARRALLAWAYGELEAAVAAAAAAAAASTAAPTADGAAAGAGAGAAPPLAFEYRVDRRRFVAAPGMRLHMYVSQPPCGDASVLPGAAEATDLQAADASAAFTSSPAGAAATGRTGAKIVAAVSVSASAAEEEEGRPPPVPQASDVERGPQAPGALRRKPGRGDATLSMSCSDKLARWSCLGAQGALLSALLEGPLHASTLAVSPPPGLIATAAGGQAAAAAIDAATAAALKEALWRAVGARTRAVAAERLRPPFAWRPPAVAAVAPPPARLGLAPSEGCATPSGFAINWSAAPGACRAPPRARGAGAGPGTHEVTLSASGRRAGTAPGQPSAATRSRLCAAELGRRFAALADGAGSRLRGGWAALGPAELKAAVAAEEAAASASGSDRQPYAAAWAALRRPPSPLAAWLLKGAGAGG